ncbi:hypothetical protein [Nocardia sp. NPDC003726]
MKLKLATCCAAVAGSLLMMGSVPVAHADHLEQVGPSPYVPLDTDGSYTQITTRPGGTIVVQIFLKTRASGAACNLFVGGENSLQWIPFNFDLLGNATVQSSPVPNGRYLVQAGCGPTGITQPVYVVVDGGAPVPGLPIPLGPDPGDPKRDQQRDRQLDRAQKTCANARAEMADSLPPGAEYTLGLLLQRMEGLPRWIGSTLFIAGCIGDALDKRGPDGTPNLIENLNSADFADAICRTIESGMDPFGFGWSKDVVCGAKAG